MSEGNPNDLVTERLCQARQKHVQAIQEDLKDINTKLDEMQSTLTELSTDTRNHFEGHSKGWNRGYAILMWLTALSAIIISIITLSLSHRKKSDEAKPEKRSQVEKTPRETEIVQYPRRYRTRTG